MLQEAISKRKLNYWDLDFEYVDILFKDILKSEIYEDYCDEPETTFKKDKQFIIRYFY